MHCPPPVLPGICPYGLLHHIQRICEAGGSYMNVVMLDKIIALVKVMEMVVEVQLYELRGWELGESESS